MFTFVVNFNVLCYDVFTFVVNFNAAVNDFDAVTDLFHVVVDLEGDLLTANPFDASNNSITHDAVPVPESISWLTVSRPCMTSVAHSLRGRRLFNWHHHS